MHSEFWHERWAQDIIHFHQDQVNPYLQQYWSRLELDKGSRVFVPMCGKSKDMLWLLQQGYQVVANELSEKAVQAFFAEQNMHASLQQHDDYHVYTAADIQIWCGDYFTLQVEDVGVIDAVYDRAALIAMPTTMRQDYTRQMLQLAAHADQCLITLEYDENIMQGPPFPVFVQEINDHYAQNYHISRLYCEDVLKENQKFRERGLTYLSECLYLLKAK